MANAAYRDANMRTVVQSGVYFPFVEFMSAAAVVIVLWYGGSLVSGGAIEIGVLVAFIGYLNSFFDPLQQLSQLYNTFQASMAAVQKIYTVLDTDPDMLDAPDAVDLPDVRGEVELRDVTFGYDADKPVLHDVDLDASRRGRPSRWSAPPAPASRRSSSCWRASTTRPRARCSSTATTCAA